MANWKDKLYKGLQKVEPYTRAAERIVTLGAQLHKATPLSVAGVISVAVNSALEWREGRARNTTFTSLPLSKATIDRALREMGAVVAKGEDSGSVVNTYTFDNRSFVFFPTTGCLVHEGEDPEFDTWIKQALDRVLPQCFKLENGGSGIEEVPLRLAHFDTERGKEITDFTLPLIGKEGRCILLDGRPGVGKTTMAQEIARRSNLGRVVQLGASIFRKNDKHRPLNDQTVELISLHYLPAQVIILDDIDKLSIELEDIEYIRKSAKLVIFTANNGAHDEVIDGAMIRPDRIDEVFTIKETTALRQAPFDALPDDVWEEVREWPIAYQNELAARIRTRGTDPNGLRLDDLKKRIERRTRSKGGIFRDDDDSE